MYLLIKSWIATFCKVISNLKSYGLPSFCYITIVIVEMRKAKVQFYHYFYYISINNSKLTIFLKPLKKY